MSLPPSSSANQESRHISELADADLSAIFEYLPPYERLRTAEVSHRWHSISRKAWLDVKSIDLSPIPGKHINAVIHQCPNLQSVFAQQKSFGPRELYCLPKAANLSRVKFYDCNFMAVSIVDTNGHSDFALIFSEQLKHTSWNEFVIHNSDTSLDDEIYEFRWPRWSFAASNLPASLTRLQLSGLISDEAYLEISYDNSLKGLELLPNLESLILLANANWGILSEDESILDKIASLKNLKELVMFPEFDLDIPNFVASLPKLEVLFLYGITDWSLETLGELITDADVLRILLLSAESPPLFEGRAYNWRDSCQSYDDDIQLPLVFPARKRFPHGFGSDPLPLLHIFIGSPISPHVRFTSSSSDAAIIHPINAPLPEFLEREDIAPIFEGVWVAEKIKETAKHDPALWLKEDADANNCIQFI